MKRHDDAMKKLSEQQHAAAARKSARIATMPKLTGESVEEYLDWLSKHSPALDAAQLSTCLQLAELMVRLQMGKAQAKDTQHTLVRDGIIDPPPPASGGGQSV